MNTPTAGRIARMPQALAEVIAAGEVVERPASVVRELVENSLDAGATHIEVRIYQGGKSAIEVTDDGRGIHSEDLLAALERHTTSKLYTLEDLNNITSFGFRGEALASMAAVAELTLESRTKDSAHGAGVHIQPGAAAQGPYPVARPPGTHVRVEHLFATVPARRKFLKTDTTEAQRVRDVLKEFVLAHPEVSFTFLSGDRRVWHYPATTLDDRVRELYPDGDWLPVQLETPHLRVLGLVSHPHVQRPHAGEVHLYVNRRLVRDAMLRKAVAQAYERVLTPGRWPRAVLFVDLDPAAVDVNVHPAKIEVRFQDPGGVFAGVHEAVAAALVAGRTLAGARVPSAHAAPNRGTSGQAQATAAWTEPRPQPGRLQLDYALLGRSDSAAASTAADGTQVGDNVTVYGSALGDLVPLGALGQRYLIYREGSALLLVDQHAAHERVRYDHIIAALEGRGAPAQELLDPPHFVAEPVELEGWHRGGDWLARIGFVVEAFGPETLRLRSVPQWFRGDPLPAVRDSLREFGERGVPETVGKHAHQIAASLACKGAILSGREVSIQEQQALIAQLLTTPGAHTCPHGRPTYRRISVTELDRWFGR